MKNGSNLKEKPGNMIESNKNLVYAESFNGASNVILFLM